MKSQKRNRKFSQRLVAAANKKAKTPGKKEKHLQELACYEAFCFSTAFIIFSYSFKIGGAFSIS